MTESNIPNNPIITQKQAIIDLFAEFYGEEFKDKITKNMDNSIFIFAELCTFFIYFVQRYLKENEI